VFYRATNLRVAKMNACKSEKARFSFCFLLSLLLFPLESSSKPTFSKIHGLYGKSFTVEIIPSIAGAEIRYTTNGCVPTGLSRLYSEPLSIDETTILRAIEIIGDSISETSTVSYIFIESVINQPNDPDGYPSQWGKFVFSNEYAPADYEMDPGLVCYPEFELNTIEGLKDIPVLSIVTDKDNLFNEENDAETGGIYIFTGTYEGNGGGVGKGWTRPASVELFGPSSRAVAHPQMLDMTADCGLRLHGGSSRVPEKSPKHSFRLIFKKEYGEEKLNYPIFGEAEPTGYDQLILRSGFGLTWHHWAGSMRPLAQYTRDVWARRMQRKMGHLADNALYVNLFLNGLYWGLYNIAERIDDQYCKIHLGGKKSDYDVVKVEDDFEDVIEATEGDLEKWDEMTSLIRSSDNDESYFRLMGKGSDGTTVDGEALLDVDNFIDYMLINQMSGNTDWGRHNWFAVRKKSPDTKGFQFVCWDSESIFVDEDDMVLSLDDEGCPTGFFNLLLRNKHFADKYVRRASEVLAPDGLLGPKSVIEVWDSLYYTIQNALWAESVRWGDYRRYIHMYDHRGDTYTMEDHYLPERERLLTNYFPYRSQYVLEGILAYVEDKTGRDYRTSVNSAVTGDDEEYEVYDLSGKLIGNPQKGIIIKGRKKHIKR